MIWDLDKEQLFNTVLSSPDCNISALVSYTFVVFFCAAIMTALILLLAYYIKHKICRKGSEFRVYEGHSLVFFFFFAVHLLLYVYLNINNTSFSLGMGFEYKYHINFSLLATNP